MSGNAKQIKKKIKLSEAFKVSIWLKKKPFSTFIDIDGIESVKQVKCFI